MLEGSKGGFQSTASKQLRSPVQLQETESCEQQADPSPFELGAEIMGLSDTMTAACQRLEVEDPAKTHPDK